MLNKKAKKRAEKPRQGQSQIKKGPVWVDGVLMVPRTPDGALCRILREAENDIRSCSPNAVKVLKETGTQVKKTAAA